MAVFADRRSVGWSDGLTRYICCIVSVRTLLFVQDFKFYFTIYHLSTAHAGLSIRIDRAMAYAHYIDKWYLPEKILEIYALCLRRVGAGGGGVWHARLDGSSVCVVRVCAQVGRFEKRLTIRVYTSASSLFCWAVHSMAVWFSLLRRPAAAAVQTQNLYPRLRNSEPDQFSLGFPSVGRSNRLGVVSSSHTSDLSHSSRR